MNRKAENYLLARYARTFWKIVNFIRNFSYFDNLNNNHKTLNFFRALGSKNVRPIPTYDLFFIYSTICFPIFHFWESLAWPLEKKNDKNILKRRKSFRTFFPLSKLEVVIIWREFLRRCTHSRECGVRVEVPTLEKWPGAELQNT